MILDPYRTRRQSNSAGRKLYDSAVRQGRSPALYAVMGAPDTVEGRFEVLTLHVILLIDRLGSDGVGAPASRQAIFDTYISDLDGALREMGVGDLSVGKRMKALGRVFYGRANAYQAAFRHLPDSEELRKLVQRTILADSPDADAPALAAYVVGARAALAGCDIDKLLSVGAPWPAT